MSNGSAYTYVKFDILCVFSLLVYCSAVARAARTQHALAARNELDSTKTEPSAQ